MFYDCITDCFMSRGLHWKAGCSFPANDWYASTWLFMWPSYNWVSLQTSVAIQSNPRSKIWSTTKLEGLEDTNEQVYKPFENHRRYIRQFYLTMSFIGTIDYLMRNSRLESVLKLIYADHLEAIASLLFELSLYSITVSVYDNVIRIMLYLNFYLHVHIMLFSWSKFFRNKEKNKKIV